MSIQVDDLSTDLTQVAGPITPRKLDSMQLCGDQIRSMENPKNQRREGPSLMEGCWLEAFFGPPFLPGL